MLLYFLAIPVLSVALVAWAVVSRRLASGPRRASMVATILLVCGILTLLRTCGVSGDGDSDLHWRWTQSPEERLLTQAGHEPATLPSAPAAAKKGADWPGFRGPDRDGIVRGVRIETDLIGLALHRSNCGVSRSDRAGRPSRSAKTFFTRRSSAVTREVRCQTVNYWTDESLGFAFQEA